MILGPGTHRLRRSGDADRPFVLEYASVSAQQPSRLRVWVGDALVEDVYVGAHSPHTWWSNNPLLTEAQYPPPGGEVVIEVGEGAVLRLEANLEPLP